MTVSLRPYHKGLTLAVPIVTVGNRRHPRHVCMLRLFTFAETAFHTCSQ